MGITEREVSLAWEPAQVGNAQVQQVFVSADNGNTWQYNAIADEGPMLPPHSGSLNGEHYASALRTCAKLMLAHALVLWLVASVQSRS